MRPELNERTGFSPVGLYVHVPFCQTRCHFCAFYLEIHREDRAQRFMDALSCETRLHAEQDRLEGRRLETVYFGGGTPTTMSPLQLTSILDQVRERFRLNDHAEVTVEAHPGSVTADGLRHLATAGFTRISLGAQSMSDTELLLIGRRSDHELTAQAVTLARAAGFGNINLDLIYGLPGQTLDGWLTTLDEVVSLEPTHLSCYALTIEENTRLHIDIRRGDRTEPDADLQNEMEDAASRYLRAAGFARYEISNYCLSGYACRHNLLYWQGGDYLGLGPSAQSYLNGRRFGNVEGLDLYCRMLEATSLPMTDLEELDPAQRLREAIVFGLRLTEGVDRAVIQDDLLDSGWQQAVDRMMRQGLLESRAGRVRLTDRGRRLADSVAVELI